MKWYNESSLNFFLNICKSLVVSEILGQTLFHSHYVFFCTFFKPSSSQHTFLLIPFLFFNIFDQLSEKLFRFKFHTISRMWQKKIAILDIHPAFHNFTCNMFIFFSKLVMIIISKNLDNGHFFMHFWPSGPFGKMAKSAVPVSGKKSKNSGP